MPKTEIEVTVNIELKPLTEKQVQSATIFWNKVIDEAKQELSQKAEKVKRQ
jgi:hypothetical protein